MMKLTALNKKIWLKVLASLILVVIFQLVFILLNSLHKNNHVCIFILTIFSIKLFHQMSLINTHCVHQWYYSVRVLVISDWTSWYHYNSISDTTRWSRVGRPGIKAICVTDPTALHSSTWKSVQRENYTLNSDIRPDVVISLYWANPPIHLL